MKPLLVSLLLLPLVACGGGGNAKVIDSSSQGVTIRYDGSDSGLNKANKLAKLKCADNGRASALLSSSKTDESHVASYECRKPD